MNSPAIHKAKEKEKAGHAHVRGESYSVGAWHRLFPAQSEHYYIPSA